MANTLGDHNIPQAAKHDHKIPQAAKEQTCQLPAGGLKYLQEAPVEAGHTPAAGCTPVSIEERAKGQQH